ncbi:hypothetical protein ATE84_2933 [Aquimarina sp. MAR_2010_214]|uniref:hypothetical protein n=1 Tax=Aquimarina sp. MAR_2010_214 TaxID=1250026 RepID=UPI000C709C19|nr:hypothetical protein [Aquimarina sp. MAR_2010_214]PKV50865.1 hypothetical protein ATE84_2933 [Aquimarina sp. MAR_2010_214]
MSNTLHHHEKISQEYGELSALIDLVELPPNAVSAATAYGEVAYSVHSGRNSDFGVISSPRGNVGDTIDLDGVKRKITSVDVMRVQDVDEGMTKSNGSYKGRCPCSNMQRKPKDPMNAVFKQTWCHIHGYEFTHFWQETHGNYDDNPYVFVYGLNKHTQNEIPLKKAK